MSVLPRSLYLYGTFLRASKRILVVTNNGTKSCAENIKKGHERQRSSADMVMAHHQTDKMKQSAEFDVPTKVSTDNEQIEESAELSTEWTAEELALKEKAIAENSWTPIYRYRGFVGVWFMLRFNLVFFAFALSSLPLSMVNEVPIAPSLGLILWSSIIFVAIKKYYTRIVAVISVDTASRSIYRIGYPSLFAGRRNRFARFLDVVPLSNNSDSVRGVARLRFADGTTEDDFLLVPTVNVEIPDKKAAFVLFGSAMHHFDKDVAPSAIEEKRRKKVEEIIRQRIEKGTKAAHQIGEKREKEERPKIEGK